MTTQRYAVSWQAREELKHAAHYIGLSNVRVWQTAPWGGEWRLSGTTVDGDRVQLGAKSKKSLHRFINRLQRGPQR